MEAKDTVMSIGYMKTLILAKHCSPETTAKDIIITDVEQDLVNEQAELSFKAGYEQVWKDGVIQEVFNEGKKVGRKEAVDWVYKNAGLGAKTIEELNKGYQFIPIRRDKWQAKLKEWGIE